MIRACRRTKQLSRYAALLLLPFLSATPLIADGDTAPSSPKPGWGDFEVVEESIERPLWEQLLLWPVNRVVDLYEVFRVDAGIGAATGGVIRVTEYGQAGYREMHPGSLRIGAFGRNWPALIEESDEKGIGPGFTASRERTICTGEIGAGLDVVVVGLYGGICSEELFDFLLGIFLLDPLDDDIR